MTVRLPSPARSRAVLVGVSAYADGDLDDIPAAARNVADLRSLLAGVAETSCVADPATPTELMSPVHAAASAAEDVLVLYFTGHGLLEGRQELHLAVSGSVRGRPWTAVPYAQVAAVVRDSPAEVKVVILDCCYSGRATAVPLSGDGGAVDQVEIDGAYVMTSCSGTSQSWARPGDRHTLFTGTVLDVLAAATRAPEDLLPMTTLFDRVHRRLKSAGFPPPQQYHTNNAGRLALVRGLGTPPPPPPAPVEAAPRPSADEVGAFLDSLGGGHEMRGGYERLDVHRRLRAVVDRVRDPDCWIGIRPPYFAKVWPHRKGYRQADVDAFVLRHRPAPVTFPDRLRTLLLDLGFTPQAGGDTLGTTSYLTVTTTGVRITARDTELALPFEELKQVTIDIDRDTVVTATDQGGLADDVYTLVVRMPGRPPERCDMRGHEFATSTALHRIRMLL